jgi:hypothetical protein
LLRYSKDSCASLVHTNLFCFLMSLKKWRPLTLCHEMNQLKEAIHPSNFLTSWKLSDGAIFVNADTFSTFGLIPCRKTIYPSNLLQVTLNLQFSRFNIILIF